MDKARNTALAVLGGAAGGVVGFYAFGWILRQGFYAVALPGVLMGMGCGMFLKRRSIPMGVVCGIAGLALGIFSEWWHHPFIADHSLPYFITHLHFLQPVTLLLILCGAILSFWFGMGRDRLNRVDWPQPQTRSDPSDRSDQTLSAEKEEK